MTQRLLLEDVAAELEAQLPTLHAELGAELGAQIPDLAADDALRGLLLGAVAANVSTVLGVLAYGIPLDQTAVPAVAVGHARRLAQREVPLDTLLRAYRLGEARFVQWWLRALAERSPDPAALASAAQQANAVAACYVDQVCQHLTQVYRRERTAWGQHGMAARAADVRTVLDDRTLDVATAEATLGYRLGGPHIAVIVWAAEHDPDPSGDLQHGADLVAAACRYRPLTALADEHTLWAWVSGSEPTLLDERQLALSLHRHGWLWAAVGEPAPGLAGFRSSHDEAHRARGVAAAAGPDAAAVTRFGRVGIPALLTGDLDGLRAWVARTLGELARDDEPMARLRETVRTFLATGGSYTDAAARLYVHRNTVHYRVRKAADIRGRPLDEERLDVEVALLACQQLGRAVLS